MSENRAKCLVALTAFRFSPGFATAALESARDRSEDVVLCLVRERAKSDAMADRLADSGFLAERMLHDLQETMATEYRARGLEYLRELAEEAARLGIRVDTMEVEGAFPECIAQVAREVGAGRIVVTRLERPTLARVFFGSEVDRLTKLAPCPVEVFDRRGAAVEAERP
ncbi:MAG TPA: universal stress protein [bacterium]|nr:universal stress protein [bacterium]